MLPNLFIPGAQKSGTSSLFKYLKQHPDCLMSNPKEPSFFSKKQNLANIHKYEECFILSDFEKKSPIIIGEATTGYMVETYVPKRIIETLGTDLKFIFILRDPVERTISAYWHLYKRFHEKRSIEEVFSFKTLNESEVIEQESIKIESALKKKRIKVDTYIRRYDDYLWPFRYIKNSLYSIHISRYNEYFEQKNILIIFLENFKRNPKTEFQKVENFLGIDNQFIPEDLENAYNITFIPKSGLRHSVMNYIFNSSILKIIRSKINFINTRYKNYMLTEKREVDKKIKENLEKIFIDEKKRQESL